MPPSSSASGSTQEEGASTGSTITYCASCDRCRARKTKCDGGRPCGNCAARYMKKHKLTSIDGTDPSLFECVYSPAKRRGPVPGRVSQARKNESMSKTDVMSSKKNPAGGSASSAMPGIEGLGLNTMGASRGLGTDGSLLASLAAGMGGGNNDNINQKQLELLQQHIDAQKHQLATFSSIDPSNTSGGSAGLTHSSASGASNSTDDQLNLMAQQRQLLLQAQAAQQFGGMSLGGLHSATAGLGDSSSAMPSLYGSQSTTGLGGMYDVNNSGVTQQHQQQLSYLQQLQAQQQQFQGHYMGKNGDNGSISQKPQSRDSNDGPAAQRPKLTSDPAQSRSNTMAQMAIKYAHLLNKSNADGNRLRSFYHLSIDELFRFPPVPSDEEYAAKLMMNGHSKMGLTKNDRAALQGARFSEIALGALANNQVLLACKLSNATVACLTECVSDSVHPLRTFELAKTYFLHGMFRSLRGDFIRYFKYRRVCLLHLSLINETPGIHSVLSAIAFHDAWIYMLYNADKEKLPNIDGNFPQLPHQPSPNNKHTKYGISTEACDISCDPSNQMWLQGTPPVFINNKAPPLDRAIDALACAIRSCCDQANKQFNEMMNANGSPNGGAPQVSPTTCAVMAHENELCSRNMVLSAFTLLQMHEASSSSVNKNHGHHLIVSAMDAFLENGEEQPSNNEQGAFKDSQIQSLLSVCNTAVERPLLLHQGGPTYHMVTNAAILLCHLLNGMHANRNSDNVTKAPDDEEMENALFEEVFDTYTCVRKLLNMHRRTLPVKLRCHSLPRPISNRWGDTAAPSMLIDMESIIMCTCRGCQGFVLMACSPCVAAERLQTSLANREMVSARETHGEADGLSSLDRDIGDLRAEFDLDDDELLNVLSRIIQN